MKILISQNTPRLQCLQMSLQFGSVLREKGVESAVNAGLSLGEYAALVASGVMTPEDAFRVVTKRGDIYAGSGSNRRSHDCSAWG